MNLNQLLARFTEWWSTLTARRRSLYVVSASAVLALLVFLGQWLGRVDYAPLFTRLDAREASAVVERLKEQDIPYRLSDQGSTVMVPEEKVLELRLDMAGSGTIVPGEGVGLEIFDQNQLGMTDFERQVNLQRALQEELRRTIVQLEEVDEARIHLVLPEESLFVRDERPASASVVLKLNPLARLAPRQVKGIVYLVASSVRGLKPENVNVIDSQGDILSDSLPEEGDGSELAASSGQQQRMELKRAFEKDLEQRVQRLLERIVGQGKAVAMVNAELDFNQSEVTRIDFDSQGALLSERVVTETGTTPTAPSSEVPTYVGTENGASTSSKSDTTRNFEVPRTEEHVVYAPGKLERLSTAVAVDGTLSASEETKIRDMVNSALGFQPARGDQLSVINMAFNNEAQQEIDASLLNSTAERAAARRRLYIYSGVAAGIFLLGIIFFAFRRMALRARVGQLVDVAVGQDVLVEEIKPVVLTDPGRESQERAREVVRRKPEEAAQLLRAWMGEE